NNFIFFRRFSAPEVIDGNPPTMASDVYSLGVLGYLLITNQYPIDEESEARGVHAVRPLQRVMEKPPAWGDEILLRALEYDASARFASASEMLNAIRDCKQESFLSSLMPVKYGIDQEGGKSGDRSDAVLITGPVMRSSGIPTMDEKLKSQDLFNKRNKGVLYGSIGGLILALVCIAAWALVFREADQVKVDPVEQQIAAVSQNLKVRQAMAMIGAGTETEDRADTQYFSELAASDDPLVADVLVRSATDPKSNASRLMAEKAIMDRSKRLGFLRSSEELRQWLDRLPTGEPPASYGPMLRVVDPTLPQEARAEMLRKIAQSHSTAALKMAAALVLDSAKPDSFEAVFRELVKSIRGESLNDKMGMPEMLFAVPETSSDYGSLIMQNLESYDDQKLYAFLDVLVEEKDLRSDAVIKEILRRNILSPLRAFFLSSIDFQGDISSLSLSALIHAATGHLDQGDLQGLGALFSGNSEKVLLGICADLTDATLRTSVFDILAGRSTVSEPATSLIAWLRAKKWEQRGDFARMIGMMAVMELIPPEAYQEIYSVIDRNIKEEAFMVILTESAPLEVLKYILNTHATHISARQAFNLLLSDNKEIRIAAIGLLKGLNDATAIKLIIDRFENEKDPDVRKAYSENFWFIKQRQ
ncbi:MAG: hypothetical protein GYA55_06340, partial [SAR324 cluster bacterium]|nr:hypothetical protein [SAR324 cluster bacterium]